jgi:anti-sigma factor RsiW
MNCGEAKEIIQLYLDDELSSRETLEAQKHLESCEPCSALLESFARQDELLRKAAWAEQSDSTTLRASILASIGESSVPGPVSRFPVSKRWRYVIAAAAMIILVMGFLWGISLPGINDKVYADAVRDHMHHCTVDRLEQFKATNDKEELNRLCAQYGQLWGVPDLTALGFSDPRGKICGLNGVRALHIVYQSAEGKPLSIFVRPHAPDLSENLSLSSKDDFHIASVTSGNTDFVIVTNLDAKKTEEIAQLVAKGI